MAMTHETPMPITNPIPMTENSKTAQLSCILFHNKLQRNQKMSFKT